MNKPNSKSMMTTKSSLNQWSKTSKKKYLKGFDTLMRRLLDKKNYN